MNKKVLYAVVCVLAVGLVAAAFWFVPDKNDDRRANMSTALDDPTESDFTEAPSSETQPETTTEEETTEPETYPYGTYKGVHLPVPSYYGNDIANEIQIQEFGGYCSVGTGDKKIIYLTFHVLPGQYEETNRILDILKQWGMHSIFYVTGEVGEGADQLYQRIVAEGHEIGNGALSTLDGGPLSDTEAVNRIQDCSAAIKAACGAEIKFFRPSLGAYTMRELYIAKQVGMKPIGYTWSYFDYDLAHQMDGDYAFQIMKSDLKTGRIYLLHTGSSTTGALSKFIDYALKQGFSFGTLE